jgi:hypothetical protein
MSGEKPEGHAEIDWAAAEVSGATLTVGFAGEASKEWVARFDTVAERLGHGGGWGAVKVKKKRVVVEDVADGAEGDLRHFLESVAQQVNADLAPEPSGEEEDAGDDGASEEDRRMTETFRSFAPGDAPDEQDEAGS